MATLTPEEERARREAALVKFETDVKILHDFLHSVEGTVINTESGPMECLRTVLARINSHETETNAFLNSLATEIDKLPVITPPSPEPAK